MSISLVGLFRPRTQKYCERMRLPAEAGHTDDSDTRNRGVTEFCSGVKESGASSEGILPWSERMIQ